MREALINRPLVLAAAGLILGVVAVKAMVAFLVLLALFLFCRDLRACLICVCAFALAVLITPATQREIFPKQRIDVDARVVSVPKPYADESVAEISIQDTKLLLSAPPDSGLELGEVVHVRGYVQPLDDHAVYLIDRGLVGRIWAQRLTGVRQAPLIYSIGQSWRDSFIAFADKTLPSREAAAVEAVCFNVSSRLDQSDRDELIRAGTVHMVSTSGLHVGVLVLLLLAVMSLLPVPRGWQLGVVCAVLILYSIASGLHAPVIRASITSVVLSAAYLFKREPDLLSALALGVVAQILWDPTAIYDAGFQLTYVVLGAVALFGVRSPASASARKPFSKQRLRFLLSRAALVTVVAMPLTAYDYGTVSLPSLLSNACTIIVLPPLVAVALIAHLMSFLSIAIATGLMVCIVQPLSGWLLFVTDRFGGEWASLAVPAFSGYWLLLIYGLMLVVWRMRLRHA